MCYCRSKLFDNVQKYDIYNLVNSYVISTYYNLMPSCFRQNLCERKFYEMKLNNSKIFALLTIIIVTCSFTNTVASDSVELNVFKTLKTEGDAIDVDASIDGKWVFVLTVKGDLLIYSTANSKLEAKINVGKHVDQIKAGPRADTLVLSSRKNKTVQLSILDFIQIINVSGSPFKGSEDAPVVVAVFSDFE